MKLPLRRILRSIVSDEILDREEFDDHSIAEQTAATLKIYRTLLPQLSDQAPPLSGDYAVCKHEVADGTFVAAPTTAERAITRAAAISRSWRRPPTGGHPGLACEASGVARRKQEKCSLADACAS